MENRGEKKPPRDGRKGGARQSLPGEKLSVTPTKSLMATLGVPEPQNVWRNNNIPKKDQERSQEEMRNENNSKKAWQEAVERVGQADQSFGMKGSRTSWECSSAHTFPPSSARMGMGKGALENPKSPGIWCCAGQKDGQAMHHKFHLELGILAFVENVFN